MNDSPFGLMRPRLAARADGSGPTRIDRIDPMDGAQGVLRDTPILVRFSRAIDTAAMPPDALRVEFGGHVVPGHLTLSPDGLVAIWQPERSMVAGSDHHVLAIGFLDRRGQRVVDHSSGFTTGSLTRDDLSEARESP
jgi:hypothetical protein